jgi:flagellar biosynthesis protein FliQ
VLVSTLVAVDVAVLVRVLVEVLVRVLVGVEVALLWACTHIENSEVLPEGSVAVEVTY